MAEEKTAEHEPTSDPTALIVAISGGLAFPGTDIDCERRGQSIEWVQRQVESTEPVQREVVSSPVRGSAFHEGGNLICPKCIDD